MIDFSKWEGRRIEKVFEVSNHVRLKLDDGQTIDIPDPRVFAAVLRENHESK